MLRHGVLYVHGEARVEDPHTVVAKTANGERRFTGAFIMIATGSRPLRPKDIDFADDHIHDSDEILTIDRLPDSLIVLGGGVIGCEYACMFAALGSRVTLVDSREHLLTFLDREIVIRLVESMQKLGIELRQGRPWKTVVRSGDGVTITLDGGTELKAEQVLFAAGRVGNTEGLGLEAAGVVFDNRGYVKVDEHFATSVPSILAAGDVIGFPALASAVHGSKERVGVWSGVRVRLQERRSVPHTMPYGIYTIPRLERRRRDGTNACVDGGRDACRRRALYANNPRGKIVGDTEGHLEARRLAPRRRSSSAFTASERAPRSSCTSAQAVTHLGGTVDLFIDMVFNFPTLSGGPTSMRRTTA